MAGTRFVCNHQYSRLHRFAQDLEQFVQIACRELVDVRIVQNDCPAVGHHRQGENTVVQMIEVNFGSINSLIIKGLVPFDSPVHNQRCISVHQIVVTAIQKENTGWRAGAQGSIQFFFVDLCHSWLLLFPEQQFGALLGILPHPDTLIRANLRRLSGQYQNIRLILIYYIINRLKL